MSDSKEDNLFEKLKNDVDKAKWELIAPHHERQAAFIITNDLALEAVGLAMARDESNYVREWIQQKKLLPPTEEQVSTWEEDETEFNYLIVQPYVIFQLVPEDLQ
ncbi:MAG: hypothetical protein CME69_11050 [Halobacteriovorax sp.]|nr:hypothetical protein [Halobacteriovorax sp.]|tara:strand:- start:317 stop:631 length:315 start_codon:yes stop_codon:yes gene_type:complete